MSAAIAKLPPPVLAVLAIGVAWWLSQRRAVAGSSGVGQGTRPGMPFYGQQAALAQTNRGAFTPPSGILPPTPVQSGLAFLSGLLGSNKRADGQPGVPGNAVPRGAYAQGGPSTGFYGAPTNPNFTSPGEIGREVGYAPVWTPDTQGELAARQYYLDNVDQFEALPPTIVLTGGYNGGVTDGYLDNQ